VQTIKQQQISPNPSQTDPKTERQTQRLQALLMLEAELRRQKTQISLSLWAVNELRAVVDYSQCILFRLNRSGRARASAVSSLSSVDRNAPFIRWAEGRIEQEIAKVINLEEEKKASVINVSLDDEVGKDQKATGKVVYPFHQAIFLPFYNRSGEMFGGLLMARNKPWLESEQIIASRLSETVSHGFQALIPQKNLRLWSAPKWLLIGVPLLICLVMLIPVPLTTLAPAEIIADQSTIVAAPIDGVIVRILKDANVEVSKGDLLFEFDNTELKASAEIARRKLQVSSARFGTAQTAVFADARVYRQLAIAKAEVDLAKAERTFAERKLERTLVRAARSGQLIYTDRKDWIGKPVKTGERVMEIADVKRVVLRIDLPVADAISLLEKAEVRLFLDADPLKALSAKLRHASHLAVEQPGIGLVYRIVADLEPEAGAAVTPRIGLRGTAQIFGDKVFLGFYLFRKPISAVRQYFGI